MNAIIPSNDDRQAIVGTAADHAARSGVFVDYQQRRAKNTLRRQRDDLALFAEYLEAVQFYAPATAQDDYKTRAASLYSGSPMA